jgi:PAS domain S-box-containing protein
MASDQEEADQLRSVALQNAQSILHVRRRAEEEAQGQAELLRITLASIGDAVITTDCAGHVTFMNGVAESLTGWQQAEAIGQPIDEVFHAVDEWTRGRVVNPVVQALEDNKVVALTDHSILIARDRKERAIDDSASPIRDGEGRPFGAVLIFRDVTQRRLAEDAQARLAAIVEYSQDAIISKNLDGIIQSWNRGAERLFGYTAAEAIGKSITFIIPPERLEEEHEIIARILNEERVEHFDTVRLTKHGQRIDISLSISPVLDRAGRIIGASKVARDITDRRRVEQALRDADKRKDQFIAMLAHELRNPLAPLRNGLQVMRLANTDRQTVAQAQSMMERQLGHMVRLIDDLLDISRINRNKMDLRRSRVLLSDVISSAVETSRPVIDANRHELHVSLPDEPIRLDADLTRLAQVFSNLLTNSAKYTKPGGHIWLAAERCDAHAVITVRDNGIGIPAEAMPRIFDMFSQVDRNIEGSMEGLGIGLALVKALVEMHEGVVTAHSDGPGKGSSFTIRLPLIAGELAIGVPDPEPPAPASKGTNQRILVVDDNRDSANSMAVMLKLTGNQVHTAFDGLEALKAAESYRPDVILMDVGMPRMNGYEAARRIREQDWGAGIAIIALTGWGQEDDKQRSRRAGCDGHLVKPVDLVELEGLLKQLRQESGLPVGQ